MSRPTFDDITGAYISSVGDRPPPTASATVLAMMSSLGEVAAACMGTGQHPWSSFERDELHKLLGELAVSLCALSAALEVDLGKAAASAVRERCVNATKHRKENKGDAAASHTTSTPEKMGSSRTRPPPLQYVEIRPNPSQLPPPEPNVNDERQRWQSAPSATATAATKLGPLSPRTTKAFFPELDKIAAKYNVGELAPRDFDSLGLKWCIVDPRGDFIDLIKDGRTQNVLFKDFPEYYRRANVYRSGASINGTSVNAAEAASELNVLSPTVRAATAPGYIVRRIHVGRADQMQHDAALFSPDHFKADLLSPYNAIDVVDVEYPLPPPAQNEGSPSQRNAMMAGLTSPSHAALPMSQVSPQSTGGGFPGSPPKSAPLTDDQLADFWSRVSIIESGEATGKAIAALGLTLTMPINRRWVPLTTNGEYIAVTASNAEEYLQLLREQQEVNSGKLRRVDSVKTIMMPDAPTFNYKAEAVKYGHDRWANNVAQITAPAPPSRKAFHVDYDERTLGEVLPAALQRKPLPQQIPSVAHYLEFIMSHPESFRDVFAAVTRDRSLLDRLQVTYCVPDPNALVSPHVMALLPYGTHARSGLQDLIVGGRQIRVAAKDFDKYYELVREASAKLPSSVAPIF